uniref:Opine dehydrogenase n=1 Tax=Candidatus Kentrum sp. FM TaxID=2126340 RepID=A0A450SCV9_9GAMM|nr:MAG: opine dehydrogenase [Candidatus Kentron sp. FM]VFJ56488.1 MAG: opine dehydrogenase [Candidatus Kentron sp. FM]VFK08296.1 MAG: opine dehydrogenase [Candidatus Kentron sp. FM]
MKPKFAFFGAGNLGLAHAGHMAMHGYDVSLCNRTGSKLQPIVENNNKILLTGAVSGKVRIAFVTESYEEAIAGRDIIVICTAAPGHRYTVGKLLPFLESRHRIVLHPGYMLGAVEVHRLLSQHNLADIPVSELESSLLTCRSEGGNTTNIKAIKHRLGFATLPAHRNWECLSPFLALYGRYLHARDSIMETGMLNLNFIIHPPISLLNAAAIDNGQRFLQYHDGVTEHVANLAEAMDNERIAVCNALGIPTTSLHEWDKIHYPTHIGDSSTLASAFRTNAAYSAIYHPDTLYSRYIWEDIPYGVMPVISLGAALGAPTPAMEAVVGICKAMFRMDWDREARTLENLGLGGLNKRELLQFMITGNA